MAQFQTLDTLDVAGKTVLVRVDFNVPMHDGKVTDPSRIRRAARTVRELVDRKAKVVLLSHFGRPKGERVPEMSLKPTVQPLQDALDGLPVGFAEDCVGAPAEHAVAALAPGQVVLLENLRYHKQEEKDDPGFADQLAKLGELYLNDAFSAAHRAHASVHALAKRLPSGAGRLMQEELEHLEAALETPRRPMLAVVGGAKVSTKLDLLSNLVTKVDALVIGGGMANTFLHAQGHDVGGSLCEKELAETANRILQKARAEGGEIILPTDAVVARELEAGVETETCPVDRVPGDKMILDAGPETVDRLCRRLEDCRTIVWNGPLGTFETPPFDRATNQVAAKAAELTKADRLLSVAGGGDTVSALTHAGVLQDFSYVSAAGGAFLEWLEGKDLPGVRVLAESA
ncbi:phosphoglycerate kinase [Rhodovibrio sodomensis]|uniref:Phosphoglycerate kinase n=1 Tax=Rhodovibrio sodomensis TaxID=1088 RepID=A0ABS1DJ29_9PROT|nr:phosphoglycerate kinase [Rhodovibrio sodomensis]MBK1670501.1 phosphoglycerate kinase [Rhodovibrio sodomensis]